MALIEIIRRAKEAEEDALKEYKEILKELKSPEDAELKRVILRLAVDKIFHKELMEAIERAYKEASKLLREHIDPYYPELEPIKNSIAQADEGLILIPGIPSLVIPTGTLGYKIPPEDILEEILSTSPEVSIMPRDKAEKMQKEIEKLIREEREMEKSYESLEDLAKHPVIKDIARSLLYNEAQHRAILKAISKKFKI
ncbi:hypothetical protein [Pyrococcus abyssi]|uniref:Rubrerythrin diiron-binding domain-containing protein n=1 Tax=Pyrococcus abyssi (strain GE5 / Orsay) TaxID=272844 RepID=Q9UZN5_PYRAB|nr:hypothetical protein [Pyrococcus abyssi]CAB50022.1 Hypothetical protein PAB0736 [Pyrococcus abyssi GE5]CCE70525.1 TPA: hypothetical protein PAB0736 [Pyrococcus abyssi GE5]